MGNCLPHRHVVKYHPNGRKARESHFEYGTPVGEWGQWYENGQLKKLTVFDGGRMEKQSEWFDTGLPSYEYRVVGGRRHYLTYHENGTPSEQWSTIVVSMWTSGRENPGDVPMYEEMRCGLHRWWDVDGDLIKTEMEGSLRLGSNPSDEPLDGVRWWRDDGSLE